MAMFKVSCENELPAIPDHLSDVCKDFLRCCLQLNPLHRATASQLLEHPFVKSSSPLGKHMLASPSSAHPVVTSAAKPEDRDCGRSPHLLNSGKVVSSSSMASFQSSNIYTPRYRSAPVSPVGSPLPHPASPQQLKQQISSPSMGMIQPPHLNQINWLQGGDDSPKSAVISKPSYWDPKILQAVFRFS